MALPWPGSREKALEISRIMFLTKLKGRTIPRLAYQKCKSLALCMVDLGPREVILASVFSEFRSGLTQVEACIRESVTHSDTLKAFVFRKSNRGVAVR